MTQPERISGYLVLFGDAHTRDLDGEYFSEQTDFGLGLYDRRPVFYHHAQDPALKATPIGEIERLEVTPRGIWAQAQLTLRGQYRAALRALLADGHLGWSSGALPASVERDADGHIRKWYIIEGSLTPTPADPRNFAGMSKAVYKFANSPAQRAGFFDLQPSQTQPEEERMTEKTTAQPTSDLTALQSQMQALGQSVHQLQALIEAAPAVKSAGFSAAGGRTQPRSATLKAVEGRLGRSLTEDEHHALKAADDYARYGVKAAMEAGTDSEGGYLVPVAYGEELARALTSGSIVRAAGARVIAVSKDGFRVPRMTHSAAAVLTAEEASFDEKEPTFAEVTFSPYKYTRLSKVSDELLTDSRIDVFGQILVPDAANAFVQAENAAFINGSGTNEPQGVLAGATVGKTAASATAIAADEIIDLFYALPSQYRNSAVWMMHDSTAAALRKLKDQNDQYIWQVGLREGQADTLMGRPVFTNNAMPQVAAGKKSVLFGDLGYFWIADFEGVAFKRLEELYAATGQVGFRWYKRLDSHVMLAEALQVLVQAAA